MKTNVIGKIVLIGPVYPYKGGISHYTNLMYRALSKKYDTTVISYSLQYPKFLFKKEQKDYENKELEIKGAKFDINTMNPLNWINIASKIKKIAPDLVIIQWWHPYFSPCYFTLEKSLKKFKKCVVCHNVFPHERFPFDKMLTRMVLKNADGFITHSYQDTTDLLSICNTVNYEQTILPVLNVFKTVEWNRNKSRIQLGLADDDKVLLFFGFVREYKGLKYLLKAMPKIISYDAKIKLVIAGDFGKDEHEYLELIDELGIKDNIVLYKEYISDTQAGKFFVSSDLVVLPYISATQSGIVPIAYEYQKPVLVTNVGGLPDVVENEKTGYVVSSKSEGEIADKVLDYFSNNRIDGFVTNIKNRASKFSWDRMVESIEDLYYKL